MYEQHNIGYDKTIPPETSCVLVELNYDAQTKDQTIYSKPIGSLIEDLESFPPKKKLITEAKKHQITLAFGDVSWEKDGYNEKYLIQSNELIDRKEFYMGLSAICGGILPELGRKITEEQGKISWLQTISRRSLIKSISRTLTTSLAAYGLHKTTGTATFLKTMIPTEKPFTKGPTRLQLRLYGLASDIHPEHPGIFTRNLIAALKLKQIGQYYKDQGIQKPIIGFNYGRAHAGIEDFLTVPPDILRKMIVYINKQYLKDAKELFESQICQTRMIQVNERGIFEDLPPIIDTTLLYMLGYKTPDPPGPA